MRTSDFCSKFILPLSRAVMPLTKKFFGQSLAVEAERLS